MSLAQQQNRQPQEVHDESESEYEEYYVEEYEEYYTLEGAEEDDETIEIVEDRLDTIREEDSMTEVQPITPERTSRQFLKEQVMANQNMRHNSQPITAPPALQKPELESGPVPPATAIYTPKLSLQQQLLGKHNLKPVSAPAPSPTIHKPASPVPSTATSATYDSSVYDSTGFASNGEDMEEEEVTKFSGSPAMASGGMAAMVAAAAAKRNDRIDKGGPVQIRVVPEEHRSVFVSVADAAAGIGRLTRLNEVIVEAVAPEKEEEDDSWIPSGLRTDHTRSNFFMCVNEAAAMGQMRRLKPVITTNYEVNPDVNDPDYDLDRIKYGDNDPNQRDPRLTRTHFLLDDHIKEHKREKDKDWAPENVADKTSSNYKSLDDVELPTEIVPRFKPKKFATEQTKQEALDAISAAVAEKAWERQYRLGRPNAALKVTRRCPCPYCDDPNPYQTHAYKKLWADHILLPPEELEKKYSKIRSKNNQSEWKPPARTPPPPVFQKPVPVRKWEPSRVKTLDSSKRTTSLPPPQIKPKTQQQLSRPMSTQRDSTQMHAKVPEPPQPVVPTPKEQQEPMENFANFTKVEEQDDKSRKSKAGSDMSSTNHSGKRKNGSRNKKRNKKRRQKRRERRRRKKGEAPPESCCGCVVM